MSTFQLILLFYLSLGLQYLEENRYVEPLDKTVILDNEKSHIRIIGTTNVNEFSCMYEAKLLIDTLEVRLEADNHMTSISGASFQLPISNFKCVNSQMTEDFQALLQVKKYPEIKIKILGFYKAAMDNYIKTSITLAGVEKHFDVLTDLDRRQDVFYCEGKPELCITDFGLEAPEKFFGLVKVNENINVEFYFTFTVYDL